MTVAPICPVHGTAMIAPRSGHGNWFCPKKTGPGPKDYCQERAMPVEQATPAPSTGGSSPAPAAAGRALPNPSGDTVAAAALIFAGLLWGGTQSTADAIQSAVDAYKAMKALQ